MIGDRRHLRVEAIPRTAHYPERPATGTALAESLRATYSYAQHAGVLIAQWWAPMRPRDRTVAIALGESTALATTLTGQTVVRVLTAPCILSRHWDVARAEVYVAVEQPLGTTPLQLRLGLLGSTTSSYSLESEPVWTDPPATHLPRDVHRITVARPLSGEPPDTRTTAVLDLLRADFCRVLPISATIWAEVG